jgi:hypothetical protein
MVLVLTLGGGTGVVEPVETMATVSGRSQRWHGCSGHPRPQCSYLDSARASLTYPEVVEKAGHMWLEGCGATPQRHGHATGVGMQGKMQMRRLGDGTAARPSQHARQKAAAQRGASSSCDAVAMVGQSVNGSRASVTAGHRGPRVTDSRHCGQSGQGATKPRPGWDGLGRPMRGSACGAARHGNIEHDDAVTARTRGNKPRTCSARILKLSPWLNRYS